MALKDDIDLDDMVHGRPLREWVELDTGPVYHRSRRALRPFFMNWYRVKAHGLENVPDEGRFLYCPNHASWAEPFIQGIIVSRTMRWMGKKELDGLPLLSRWWRSGGYFPVERGKGDVGSINLAQLMLEYDHPLVMYPEGTRHKGTPGLGTPKSGPARMALATGTPIVLAANVGSKPADYPDRKSARFWRRRTTILVAKPFNVPLEPDASMERIAEVKDIIWERLTELYHAVRLVQLQDPRPEHVDIPSWDDVT